MKKLFLFLVVIVSCIIGFTQNKKTSSISIYTSVANSNDIYYSWNLIGGGKTPEAYGYYLIGLKYGYQLKHWLQFESGIEFSNHKIKTTYWTDDPSITAPDPTYGNVSLISFPISLRADFLKYCFVSGGMLLDFEMKNNSLNNQSGIGFTGSVGLKCQFKNKVLLFAGPFFEVHGITQFIPEQYPYKIENVGLKLGLGYSF